MTDLILYHAAPSRSSIARWMLEEIGAPYDVHLLDLSKGEQHSPEFTALNPMGKVPALRHGEAVVGESAAICTYLADAFPDAGLNVPIGAPERGAYLKWLFFGPGCIEPAMMDRAFPRQDVPQRGTVGYGDFELVMDVTEKGVETGPYLLGDRFTAADVVVGSNIRWGLMFKLIPERAAFKAYVDRLEQRPALQRTVALDAALADAG